MSQHFPVLVVLVPLLAAPICALLRHPRLTWGIAVLASWTSFWIATQLLGLTLEAGTVRYELGGWPAPWGIEYRLDTVNAFVVLIVSAIASIVTPYALKSVEQEVAPRQIGLFYTAWLLSIAGLLGMAVTGDMFNVFVFLEISSLSAYALIALGRERRALTSSYQYLIMGATGATFIVIGIGMLYVITGSLNMADLATRIPDVADTRTIRVAFAFLAVGVSLKLALFPLHLWLPNAYTFAPSAVTALIAATATKVAVYLFLRFFFSIFGAAFSFEVMHLERILLGLALISIFSMSAVAIFQENVKRMMAYSSVAQIGYMILGISMASVVGLTAGIIHLFNHALMKGVIFMALGCVMYRLGSVRLEDMGNLGRRMPWTTAAFVAGGLSLVGTPLTVGFISKWYLISGALEKGWWPVAAVVLLTSLMAVVYIWRVVEAAYFKPQPEGDTRELAEAPLAMLIPTWALIAANFWFGIDATLTSDVARTAAELLLGVGS